MSTIKYKILQMLKTEEYISGEFLKSELNISRTAVWKNIRSLAELGYQIDTLKGKGYQLKAIPDYLYPWELKFLSKNQYQLRYFSSIDSTNNYARSLEPPQVVIAEKQTKGRGRMGREWMSESGGIYFSLVVTPGCAIEEIPKLPLVIATAMTEVIREKLQVEAEIKWPNDILIAGKKVAGILVELSGETDSPYKTVIGIGINVKQDLTHFPTDLTDKVTTLEEVTGSYLNRRKLFDELLENITRVLAHLKENSSDLLEKWRQYSCTLGQEVTVKQVSKTVTGVAKDIDERGALIVDTESGEEQVLTGDVAFLTKGEEN